MDIFTTIEAQQINSSQSHHSSSSAAQPEVKSSESSSSARKRQLDSQQHSSDGDRSNPTKKMKRRFLTNEDLDFLWQAYVKNHYQFLPREELARIAVERDRSINSLQRNLGKLIALHYKVPTGQVRDLNFTSQEDSFMLKTYTDNLTDSYLSEGTIVKDLSMALRRDKDAVHHRLLWLKEQQRRSEASLDSKLAESNCLPKSRHAAYFAVEDDIVLSAHKEGRDLEEIATALQRPLSGVRAHLANLLTSKGLKANSVDEEDDQDNQYNSDSACSGSGRSSQDIHPSASKPSRQPSSRTLFTPEEDALIWARYLKTQSMRYGQYNDIGLQLQRTTKAVVQRLHRLITLHNQQGRGHRNGHEHKQGAARTPSVVALSTPHATAPPLFAPTPGPRAHPSASRSVVPPFAGMKQEPAGRKEENGAPRSNSSSGEAARNSSGQELSRQMPWARAGDAAAQATSAAAGSSISRLGTSTNSRVGTATASAQQSAVTSPATAHASVAAVPAPTTTTSEPAVKHWYEDGRFSYKATGRGNSDDASDSDESSFYKSRR